VSPRTSCGLPAATFARRASGTGGLLGLAPGGVFPAAAVTSDAVRSYRTISPLPLLSHRRVIRPARNRRGGVFSVALSVALPRPAVSWRPALWSSDFPRRAEARRDRLADSETIIFSNTQERVG